MREIKFRAWDKGTALHAPRMISFEEALEVQTLTTFFGDKKSDRYEVLLFTGLFDKNGVEIYEGDIFYDDADNHIGVVTFLNGAFVCESYFDGFEKEELNPSDNRCFLAERLIRDYGNVFEVIGNFYENKELLDV